MEHKVVIQKLTDCMKDIFAFVASRVYNKQDAEDLANDIIVEILSSSHRLQNDDAFYGYMWTIAENTFKRHIRRKKRADIEFCGDFLGVYWDTPENKMLDDADLIVLRRELSLLSKQYRDVTVKYYIENKSCTIIAKELNISQEMVKYYLFKTRKILKEGVTMDRKFGEKSYNPGKFYIDFWGGGDNDYVWRTFERRLPGNIVLAAYIRPMRIEELSLELGVSVPYLEDEVDILLKYGFLIKTGDKYQTNFLIFTTAFEQELREKIPTAEICMKTVDRIKSLIDSLLPQFRKKDFGITLDDNQLRWFLVNFALMDAFKQFEQKTLEKFGPYPKLNAESWGYIYGHDNGYLFSYFEGIYGQCGNIEQTAWYSVVNYNVIKSCQRWHGSADFRTRVICDGILNAPVSVQNQETIAQLVQEGMITVEDGKIKANFPTFNTRQSYWMRQQLKDIIDITMDCMGKICELTTDICKKYTPKHLQDRCERLAYICHQADVMGIVVERLVADGYLIVPDEQTNLCVFGVKRRSNRDVK